MPSGICTILITRTFGRRQYVGNDIAAKMLGGNGSKGRAPMPKPLADKAGRTYSAGYAFLPMQEPLPPYELDPMFNDPAARKRIGEVIAKAMEHRFSKR
jgi:hypothetical protein